MQNVSLEFPSLLCANLRLLWLCTWIALARLPAYAYAHRGMLQPQEYTQSGLLQLLLGLDVALSPVTGLHCCAYLQLASLALYLRPAGPTPITSLHCSVLSSAKSLQTQGSPAPQLPHAQSKPERKRKLVPVC